MRAALFIFMILFFTACGSAKVIPEDSPETANPSFTPPEKIYLSIDGGAMLGIIPLVLLDDIEQKTGKQIYQLVDGIIGTSTGAIIAALLTIPQNDGKPYSAAKALQFYLEAKNSIFSDENLMMMSLGTQIEKDQVKIRMTGLMDQKLNETFLDHDLSTALIPLKIVSYEAPLSKVYIFDSLEATYKPADDIRVEFAVRASTAIAPLFRSTSIKFNGSTVAREFIDAGTGAIPADVRIVDPTYVLFNDVKSSLAADTATIYSLGTGYLDGPSDKTTAVMKDQQIKIVRIDPDLKAYFTKITSLIPRNMVRDIAAGAPETPTYLGFHIPIHSIQAFKKAGEALKSSGGYQHMLKNIKAKAK